MMHGNDREASVTEQSAKMPWTTLRIVPKHLLFKKGALDTVAYAMSSAFP